MVKLFDEPLVVALAEMMNYPGVLNDDPEVKVKLDLAHKHGYPIAGHASGIVGEAALHYAAAGISTD